MADTSKKTATIPDDDPVINDSLSGLLMIFSLLLIGTLVWALYDEWYGLRPWKGYQSRFVEQYSAFLDKTIKSQDAEEKKIRSSDEFKNIDQQLNEEREAVEPQIAEIDEETKLVNRQIAALTKVFQAARGEVTALIYQVEVATSESRKATLQEDVKEAKKGPFEVPRPGHNPEIQEMTYDELDAEFIRLQKHRAELLAQRVAALAKESELSKARDAYLKEKLVGLTVLQLRGLRYKMDKFDTDIRQIHVQDVDLVDRCASCHLGTDRDLVPTKVVLTAKDMGGEKAFTSHPSLELLAIHDTEQFGCTPCHNGNGRATSSVEKGHGTYKHWLWPLFPKENVEAGCHQCHGNDLVLDHADVLNQGKNLFQQRGCIGCHRFEGFDRESEEFLAARQRLRAIEKEKRNNEIESDRSIEKGDKTMDDDEAVRLYARAENLRVVNSNLDHEMEQVKFRAKNLMQELKKVGPSLKEIRLKLRPEWIPVWLEDPHRFRPTTKMPAFRLDEEQRRSIAAFLWQSSYEAELPRQPRGEAGRGKELFETRGCMGCHAVGEGEDAVGGTFAANLSRVGEKANYNYLVRWVHNPRVRTRPYCPTEERDLGPEDYARHGLPFEFGIGNSACPNDGDELQVQQMTVMPSLRLTQQEARDIAGYLITLKRDDAGYSTAPYLNDPEMKKPGRDWVRHFGCAGCHEIAGFEEESRNGTELTTEGSKPIERLDFALLTHVAKNESWYNHKGFFERKMDNPAFFDQGKERTRLEKLRMPKPNLKPEEVAALTTFLLGAVDSQLPARYFYLPEDQSRDIQEGWWVIQKYNCQGCHQVKIGRESVLMTLPRYQDPDWKEQLPPSLVGEGARVNPAWLVEFLDNPAMSKTQTHGNGVRKYLHARMPTFNFSPGEIRKLVRYFEALSVQAQPYIAPKTVPLTPAERVMARQLFTHPAAPCLKCHATGEAAHDRIATAPNFLLAAERLKPGWTRRWMLDPADMSPGTAMPSGLFRLEGDRWVFDFGGSTPSAFRGYSKDHAELLVRYMFQFTPEELRRLTGR